MPSMFLPEDAEDGVTALLQGLQMDDGTPVNIGSIGQPELDDSDQLVFDPPMSRTLYVGSPRYRSDENQALVYPDVMHIVEVWCSAQDLHSKEDQRRATIHLLGRVMPILAGARVSLSDGGHSEPILILGVFASVDAAHGKVYILSVGVPGIAQFPGPQGN